MKKLLLGIVLSLYALGVGATIIQGEITPGVYINYAVDANGKLPVLASLDPAASTAALQTTGNSSLSSISTAAASIDSKTPALSSGSVPVVGTVSITGTPTVAVSGTVPVSIAGTVNVSSVNYTFNNITTNTTTTVKSGAGTLKRITFNTPGTLSQLVIYNNTSASGTKIGTVNTTLGQQTLDYDVSFSTGLTIVTTGTLAADVTVVFN